MKTFIFLLTLLFCPGSWSSPMDKAELSPPLPSNIWVEMSKITQPAVVGVYLKINVNTKNIPRDPFFNFIEEFLGESFHFGRPQKKNQESKPIGTGFLIDKEGHIVTNYHVIQPIDNPRLQAQLRVQIYGKSQLYDVEVLGSDSRGDLALLKLTKPVKGLTPLEFGDSDKLEVGEYVAAFGNPYGHNNSMAVGIVSAKGRAIKELNRFPFIQTDASINPGNSGGPLMDTKGYVVGVNSAIDARAQGIGFAIPSNYVKKVIGIIKSGGTIQKAFLGVGLASLNPRAALSFGLDKSGAVITQVEPGYPAHKAGMKPNDIIFEFNGQPIHSAESLINNVQDTEVGKTVTIKVMRPQPQGFKEMSFKVKLTQFPESNQRKKRKRILTRYPGQISPYNLGFSVADSSSGARKYYEVPLNQPFAPIVSRVRSASPAHKAGMEPGQLIMKVNGQTVHKASDVIKALKKGSNTLRLQSPGRRAKQVTLKSQ